MPPRKRKTSPVTLPPVLDAGATSPPQPSPFADKLAVAERAKPAKRARLDVAPEETQQVTKLDDYRLDLADSELFYVPSIVDEGIASGWYEELLNLDTWYRPTLKVYGRDVQQSRKIAAYATEPTMTVKYSGHDVKLHHEYPETLRAIQDLVEEHTGVSFNHVMLNLYEDGTKYIGSHADNKENRVIASLSLGAPRTFIMVHKKPGDSAGDPRYKKRWTLANGSLVVMQGKTQQFWKHEIPKEPAIKAGRISLTFRQLVF